MSLNISQVDGATKMIENRPSLTLDSDGQGSKTIVSSASQVKSTSNIDSIDANDGDTPMDTPGEKGAPANKETPRFKRTIHTDEDIARMEASEDRLHAMYKAPRGKLRASANRTHPTASL